MERLRLVLDRLAGWIEKHANLCAVALSALYWLMAGAQAASRLLWQDELTTWHVARLPSLGAIWPALVSGVDQSPPLSHLAVRLSHMLFGIGPLATRLPAMVGFWVMACCLYVFLKRRVPAPYALAAMLFPMLTLAWSYASEARPYGILLGAAGVALVCWQAAAEGRGRPLSLVGITVALAAALGCTFTAVQLALPFAAGETARSVTRRRIDWPVWLAFLAAAPVALLYPGILAVTRLWRFSLVSPAFMDIADFYGRVLGDACFPLLAAALAAYVLGRQSGPDRAHSPVLPPHEAAALIGLTVAPAVLFIGGRLARTLIYTPRYGLVAVIGMAGLGAVLAATAAHHDRRTGTAMLLVLAAWLAVSNGVPAWVAARRTGPAAFQAEHPLLMQALREPLPVVTGDLLLWFQAEHYLSAGDAARVFYLLDPAPPPDLESRRLVFEVARRHAGVLPLRTKVALMDTFLSETPRFLAVTNRDLDSKEHSWQGTVLLRHGCRISVRAGGYEETLYEVTSPVAVPPR